MLQSELRVSQASHCVHGNAAGRGLRGVYAQIRCYTIRLLATAIRRAERPALAMDGGHLAYSRRDYLFVGSFWLVSALIVLAFWQAGVLGPLVVLQQV